MPDTPGTRHLHYHSPTPRTSTFSRAQNQDNSLRGRSRCAPHARHPWNPTWSLHIPTPRTFAFPRAQNQDNYLCEALKMRNLLCELQPSNRGTLAEGKGSRALYADDDADFTVGGDEATAAMVHAIIRCACARRRLTVGLKSL
jgi:hypothetical protein